MPKEIENPYPDTTPEEVASVPGGREIKAARNVAVRKFGGIPVRAFLLGGNDHSPMMKGLLDLTTLCYRILDDADSAPGSEAYETFVENLHGLRLMLEDNGLDPLA